MARLVESSTAVPIGTIKDYAGNTIPEGFLDCVGQTLNAVANPQYLGLFAVIGNSFGGTNNTNFGVPDLRSRVVAGKEDGGQIPRLTVGGCGINAANLGAFGGLETIMQHSHTVNPHNHGGFTGSHTHDATPSDNSGSMSGGFGGTIVSTGNVSVRTSASGNQTPPINAIATTKANVASINVDAPGTTSSGSGIGVGNSHGNIQPTIILRKIIKF